MDLLGFMSAMEEAVARTREDRAVDPEFVQRRRIGGTAGESVVFEDVVFEDADGVDVEVSACGALIRISAGLDGAALDRERAAWLIGVLANWLAGELMLR